MADVAAGTDTGFVRKRNEDSAYAGRWLCAVADGMGGHVSGDIASAAVIETLQQFDVDPGAPDQLLGVLSRAISEASSQLAARIAVDPSAAGMGTTLTAMLFSGDSVAVANIGDSRAYRLRRGCLKRVTEDHVMGRLLAYPSPQSISPVLVRYLDGRADRSPDLTLRTMAPGDRYLICSDGLSGVVDQGVIADVLGSGTPGQAVADLIGRVNEAGAPDNVTLIVIDVPEATWEPGANRVVLGAASTLARAS